eukprot:271170_1
MMGLCIGRSNKIDCELLDAWARTKNEVKILLLGAGESGKSTIFKQFQTIFAGGYEDYELSASKNAIPELLVSSMCTLIENYEQFSNEDPNGNCIVVSEDSLPCIERLKTLTLKWANKYAKNFDVQTIEDLKKLWADPTIKATFDRRSEFQLFDSFPYFFNERLDDIAKDDYMPSVQDHLRCRIKTTGVHEIRYEVRQYTYFVIDVGGQRSERRKWINQFEGVSAILFVVALNGYNRTCLEDSTTNRMTESLNLFEHLASLKIFGDITFIIFLNKLDLFKKELQHTPLSILFENYDGEPNNYEPATKFIQEEFKRVWQQSTGESSQGNRRFVFHLTTATDGSVMKSVLSEAMKIVITGKLSQSGLA